MRFIAALLLFFASIAQAQTVGVHTISAHEHGGFSNVDPGLYIRQDSGWTYGAYRNSHRRGSMYFGKTWETPEWHSLSLAVTAGGVTGYPAGAVTPLFVPSVAYHFGKSAIRIGLIPKPPYQGSSAAVHLMIEQSI